MNKYNYFNIRYKLKDFQNRTNRPFKNNKQTIFELEGRFKNEEDW